ncbi:hypothetical protein GINT2_000817 [Glugoides intestinalis]
MQSRYTTTLPTNKTAFINNTREMKKNNALISIIGEDKCSLLTPYTRGTTLIQPVSSPLNFTNIKENPHNNIFGSIKIPDVYAPEPIRQPLLSQCPNPIQKLASIENFNFHNGLHLQNESTLLSAPASIIRGMYNSFINFFSQIISFCHTSPFNWLSTWFDLKNKFALSPLWTAKFEIHGIIFRYIYAAIVVSMIFLFLYTLYRNRNLLRHRKTIALRSFSKLPSITSVSSYLKNNRHLNALQRYFFLEKLKKLKKNQPQSFK